jgi:hypothetical protein
MFMTPEIIKDRWLCADGPRGTEYIPLDVWARNEIENIIKSCQKDEAEKDPEIVDTLSKYTENSEFWSLRVIGGYGARLSASGYLDCTEWSVFDTEREAREYIEQQYEVCSNCGADFGEDDSDVCSNCGEQYATAVIESDPPNVPKGDC